MARATVEMIALTSALALLPCLTQAAAIDKPLSCVVQQFTSIGVNTNTTDGATIEKSTPQEPIKVLYFIDPRNGKLIEKYSFGTETEKVSAYALSYSAGGTQYQGDDHNQVVTYFGLSGKYHVVVKYIRMQRNDGGLRAGWRADSYFNVLMYCMLVD